MTVWVIENITNKGYVIGLAQSLEAAVKRVKDAQAHYSVEWSDVAPTVMGNAMILRGVYPESLRQGEDRFTNYRFTPHEFEQPTPEHGDGKERREVLRLLRSNVEWARDEGYTGTAQSIQRAIDYIKANRPCATHSPEADNGK